MANEKETPKNELTKVGASQLAQQEFFVGQIRNLFAKQNAPLTPYQVTCGNNAVAKMVQMANNNGRDIFYYPQPQTLFTLQNIIANEWDVLQGEGVIIFQNKKYKVEVTDASGNPKKDREGKVITQDKWEQYFDLRPTVKGYVKAVRTYGAGLDEVNPIALTYVVYDGDEFEDVSYVGIEVTPPKYRPMRLSNRVKYIVYALRTFDGTIQYIVGRREQVVPALIAQANNNGAPEADLDKMAKLETVDKILEAYEGKTFSKTYYGKTEQVPYFNDTWLAGYNREQMLETKLRGVIANRMIDKEYNNKFKNELQKQAYETVIVGKPSRQSNAKERGEQLDADAQKMIDEKSFEGDKRSFKEMVIVEEEEHQEVEVEEEPIVEEETVVVTETKGVEPKQEPIKKPVVEPTKTEPTKQNDIFANFGDSFKL